MKRLGEAPLNKSVVQKYDGQLLHIIDGRFDRRYPLLLIDHESKELYDCPQLQEILSGRAIYAQLPALKSPELVKEEAGYSDRIRYLIYDGRLLITTLLTSPGGVSAVLRSVQRMHEEVERRNGESIVFVGSRAASAAALLFGHHKKQNRHCMNESKFLWHAGTLPMRNPNDGLSEEEHADLLQVSRSMDNRAIDAFFSNEASGPDAEEFLEYVRTTLQDSQDVRLRGRDLRFYNVIENVSRTIEEMRDSFASITGLPGYCVSRSYDKDLVHRFFTRTGLEQCMRSVTSRPIEYKKKKWAFEPQSEAETAAWTETMNALRGARELDPILCPEKPFLPQLKRKQ